MGVRSDWATSVAFCGKHSQSVNVKKEIKITYLVGLVGSGGSNLALLPGGELSEVAVVVTLPEIGNQSSACLYTADYG